MSVNFLDEFYTIWRSRLNVKTIKTSYRLYVAFAQTPYRHNIFRPNVKEAPSEYAKENCILYYFTGLPAKSDSDDVLFTKLLGDHLFIYPIRRIGLIQKRSLESCLYKLVFYLTLC